MKRFAGLAVAIAALVFAAPPVAAQGADGAAVQFRFGGFFPSGNSAFWDASEFYFTLDESDLPFVSGFSVSEHLQYCIRKYCPSRTVEEARRYYFEHTHREMQAILDGRGRADAFVPAPGVKAFLLALKAAGIRIGVVTSGLHEKALVAFANAPHGGSTYAWNSGGTGGALDLRDTPFSGASDLGNPDRTSWVASTRTYLNAHPEVNVIMWSWCGQADGTEEQIHTYLGHMSDLEEGYPDVKFVYMTGHTNGTGLTGNLHLRNQQIRDYCEANKKILFDFEDIESYDPDGKYFGDKNVTDSCAYTGGNWAVEWQNTVSLGKKSQVGGHHSVSNVCDSEFRHRL